MKSEPETWSWQQQVARGATGEVWDGVRNHQAANFLREMQKRDLAFFYHSGKERAIIGIVEVIKENFPDPSDDSQRFVAVKVRAKEALPKPVTLQTIKSIPQLSDLMLIRNSRLSVMPISAAAWKKIMALAKS